MQLDLPRHEEQLRELGVTFECPIVEQHLRERELADIIGDFDGMIAGDDEVTARVLQAGVPRLRVVSKWGVGVDGIDRGAAERLGIVVTNTPGVFGDEVADVVTGYLVMLVRGLHRIDQSVRRGEWLKIEGRSLSSMTLGVVGLGSIGRSLALRGFAFGMRVVGTDAFEGSVALAEAAGVKTSSLDDVLRQADVISLNCPLTPDTFHLMDRHRLKSMRPGSYLINTARGALVDEEALLDALASGHLAGAALDVFEHEPLAPDHRLAQFDNVILGSHNASNTREAVERVSALALKNALHHLGVE
jgi:D-3-phosphoglycerate dehydrogenase